MKMMSTSNCVLNALLAVLLTYQDCFVAGSPVSLPALQRFRSDLHIVAEELYNLLNSFHYDPENVFHTILESNFELPEKDGRNFKNILNDLSRNIKFPEKTSFTSISQHSVEPIKNHSTHKTDTKLYENTELNTEQQTYSTTDTISTETQHDTATETNDISATTHPGSTNSIESTVSTEILEETNINNSVEHLEENIAAEKNAISNRRNLVATTIEQPVTTVNQEKIVKFNYDKLKGTNGQEEFYTIRPEKSAAINKIISEKSTKTNHKNEETIDERVSEEILQFTTMPTGQAEGAKLIETDEVVVPVKLIPLIKKALEQIQNEGNTQNPVELITNLSKYKNKENMNMEQFQIQNFLGNSMLHAPKPPLDYIYPGTNPFYPLYS